MTDAYERYFAGIMPDMDGTESAAWLSSLFSSYDNSRGKWHVFFIGYDSDPREIWEIPHCVDVCTEVLRAGLKTYLTTDCAWLFFKVSRGLYIRGTTIAMVSDDDRKDFEAIA